MFPPHYDFSTTEQSSYWNYWLEIVQKTKATKSLLLPPPNITGNLHLGHALNSVLQDFLVRLSYLQKKPIKWIAGIDHAGIATQSKIEKLKLAELDTDEKKREYTFQTWYPRNRKIFSQQWKKLGLLINYEKASFTLNPTIQNQVKEAFIKLYRDDLIFRGKKIVNWDPQLKSVISDIEVEYRATQSKLYYLKYPLVNSNDYLLVATSRPETIFADVALFVNPHDQRYKKYFGQEVQHPVTKKILPVLFDHKVEITFGTEVLKCTPGHDFKDYELGKKHQLPLISCCNEGGILNALTSSWQGQKIGVIRETLVKELVEKNICQKIENYATNLAYSSKSGVLIEPLLSQQWFFDLPTLITKIEQKQPNFLEKINFLPSQFCQILENWKIKTQEWCISRQLWWGHRIPAWYHKSSGEIYVGTNPPLQEKEWEPEKDVLDTWFSSGLWPLIALTQENYQFPSPSSKFYPITTLITGYDIIFFWVLKMILLGFYFTNQKPFQQVLLHGLIRDSQGKKMSKSLGNGVEPEEIITKYGCDSLRLFLLENNIWGSDLVYQEEKVIGSWRFCQKLWSIANLLTRNIPAAELRLIEKKDLNFENNNLLNSWILNELAFCQKTYFSSGEENKYEINKIIAQLIKFTREKLSNNYLELVKISPWDKDTKNTLLFVYQQLLLLLHPAAPFITEYIYQKITREKLLLAEIKIVSETKNNNLWLVDCLLLLIEKIRVCPGRESKNLYFELMPKWQVKYRPQLDFNQFLFPLTKSRTQFTNPAEKIVVFSLVDVNPFGVLKIVEKSPKPSTETEKKIKFYQAEQQRSQKLLANKNFVEKAPSWLIEKEKEKINYYEKMIKEFKEMS